MVVLSLNGNMNICMAMAARTVRVKNAKITPYYENGQEKGILISQISQKNTIFSDLQILTLKKAPFSVNS